MPVRGGGGRLPAPPPLPILYRRRAIPMTVSMTASANANPAAATADAVAAALRDGMRSAADRGPLLNEASTLSLLIRPALTALGYPATHRMPEYGEARNRLDEACFLNAVTAAPGYAAVIVEAKQPGVDTADDSDGVSGQAALYALCQRFGRATATPRD